MACRPCGLGLERAATEGWEPRVGVWAGPGRCSIGVQSGGDEEVVAGAGSVSGCPAGFGWGAAGVGVEHERFLVLWVMREPLEGGIIGVRTGIWIPYRSRVGASRLSQASGLLAPLAESETTGPLSGRGSQPGARMVCPTCYRDPPPGRGSNSDGLGNAERGIVRAGITPAGGSAPNEAHHQRHHDASAPHRKGHTGKGHTGLNIGRALRPPCPGLATLRRVPSQGVGCGTTGRTGPGSATVEPEAKPTGATEGRKVHDRRARKRRVNGSEAPGPTTGGIGPQRKTERGSERRTGHGEHEHELDDAGRTRPGPPRHLAALHRPHDLPGDGDGDRTLHARLVWQRRVALHRQPARLQPEPRQIAASPSPRLAVQPHPIWPQRRAFGNYPPLRR